MMSTLCYDVIGEIMSYIMTLETLTNMLLVNKTFFRAIMNLEISTNISLSGEKHFNFPRVLRNKIIRLIHHHNVIENGIMMESFSTFGNRKHGWTSHYQPNEIYRLILYDCGNLIKRINRYGDNFTFTHFNRVYKIYPRCKKIVNNFGLMQEIYYFNKRSQLQLYEKTFNDVLVEHKEFKNDCFHGYNIKYYNNGHIRRFERYFNGKRSGYVFAYGIRGNLIIKRGYFNGVKHGIHFKKLSGIRELEIWNMGDLISRKKEKTIKYYL